jgi:3-deoxy-D-arabino-heptulosonate 7-phosphate (DAHP) synthase
MRSFQCHWFVGTGHSHAKAAIAAGADALIVEVHINPEAALSDDRHSLYPEQFEQLVQEVDLITRSMRSQKGDLPS